MLFKQFSTLTGASSAIKICVRLHTFAFAHPFVHLESLHLIFHCQAHFHTAVSLSPVRYVPICILHRWWCMAPDQLETNQIPIPSAIVSPTRMSERAWEREKRGRQTDRQTDRDRGPRNGNRPAERESDTKRKQLTGGHPTRKGDKLVTALTVIGFLHTYLADASHGSLIHVPPSWRYVTQYITLFSEPCHHGDT